MSPTADPFTAAQPTYRRAADLGAQPMPLAAFEVATFKRRPSLYGSALRGLAVLIVAVVAVWTLAFVVTP